MAQSILYYPSINIEDSEWLRSAILYWDEINSIVPYEDYFEFSPALLYLESIGQYKPIYPKDVFLLDNTNDFTEVVKRHFNRNFTELINTNQNQQLSEVLHSADLATLIHYKKLPTEILDFFTNEGIINMDSEGWRRMNCEFAFRYMRLLADFIATNSLEDTVIGTNYMKNISEVYPQAYMNKGTSAISITLEKCLPIPTMEVGLKELIDFKQRHKSELLQIRFKIRELEKNIAECNNPAQLKSTLAAFRESWEYELDQAEKMFKGRNIKFGLGSLRSFVTGASPVAGLSQWARDNNVLNIPRTAMGVAVGVSGLLGVGEYLLQHRNQVESMRHGNGFAYILSAKKAGLLKSKKNIDIVQL